MATHDSSVYRMPAEWERHEATWLSWPHNEATWPGVGVAAVEPILAEAVRELATGESVYINVQDDEHEAHVRSLLDASIDPRRLRFFHFPTNDAWCRDHGAIFVRHRHDDRLIAVNFGYNAWGGKYPPFDLDDQMPRHMGSTLGLEVHDVDMILEGGSIDVNGSGCLLTTEQCLLNPNRNPQLSRSDIEQRLRHYLGARQIIWLGGGIVGDDTDGHIDDISRFVAEDVVTTAVESDPSSPNFAPLAANLAALRATTLADRRPLRVIELPMPELLSHQGEPLPASYANFYIANNVVLMPAYDDPADLTAAMILQRCFPGRRVVSLDCRQLVVGLGAFHCLTQQLPALAPGAAHRGKGG